MIVYFIQAHQGAVQVLNLVNLLLADPASFVIVSYDSQLPDELRSCLLDRAIPCRPERDSCSRSAANSKPRRRQRSAISATRYSTPVSFFIPNERFPLVELRVGDSRPGGPAEISRW